MLKLPGIRFVLETRRFYPKGPLAAAVLGYVGTDDNGLAGLEHPYDQSVRGKPGHIVALRDARAADYGEAEPPTVGRPGGRDPDALARLGRAVRGGAGAAAAMAEHRAKSGSIVLIDPSNGEIVAMACAPSFDPNHYGRYPAEVRRNRVIADAYEPGSTFKIVTGAVALEDGVIGLDEMIDTGDGTIRVANTTIEDQATTTVR